MNKKILILVIVLVILGLGFYFYNKQEAKAPVSETPQAEDQNPQNAENQNNSAAPETLPPAGTATSSAPSTTGANHGPGVYSSSGETSDSDMQVVEVDYNGTAFSPKVTNIKKNDYVFFKNTSSVNFTPASSPHANYPAFNAAKTIAPGAQFKFQFTQAGSWAYQDDLNPSATGTINVSQ